MKLRETTKQLIALLEKKSGYRVHVREDPNLPTISTIIIARGNLPAHIISYNPGPKKRVTRLLDHFPMRHVNSYVRLPA